ncbi:hypothetical protein [Candidatus Methylocalor cossyra]|uniref:Uncharacterized protein n=1 Tax=Candidatus Methylocalor cossyra TaxID=3108543 RepID=A0ABP1CB70_9GAMM
MQVKLTACLWAACWVGALAVPPALADEDSRYPAADFKPTVVYQNPELINQLAAASKTDTAPAPSCPQPAAETQQQPDPKYPAAYFNPTVIR